MYNLRERSESDSAIFVLTLFPGWGNPGLILHLQGVQINKKLKGLLKK